MKRNNCIAPFLIIFFFISGQVSAQIDRRLLYEAWPAKWISWPRISGTEYGVYLFRKTFTVEEVNTKMLIHVSGDNRYKLYVNGAYAGNGPARGDLMRWSFETIDIAPYLKKGNNVIAAIVWNFSTDRPVAQVSLRTGFIVQANNPADSIINTNSTWRVTKDFAYRPNAVKVSGYYACGATEEFNGQQHPWGWESISFDDTKWEHAKEIDKGMTRQSFRNYGEPASHVLTPRTIPAMEEQVQYFSRVRRSTIQQLPADFLTGKTPVVIAPHTTVSLLLDQDVLTNAYPVLHTSFGKNSQIKMTYAEALYNDKGEKGNRNEIENKNITGVNDIIRPDGGKDRSYQTLWWRTFRYLQVDVQTADDSLVLNKLYSVFIGYPLKERSSFSSNDPDFEKIWNTGWHTQRLCAVETFMDCPYYEQLQYAGDSRIQALVTNYVSGDTILMRNTLTALNDSRLPFGLTQSRYPHNYPQIIPTFSLVWVTMIHDYWMHCKDDNMIRSLMPGVLATLEWFESRIDSTGMIGYAEWWNFVDWVHRKEWTAGTPPGAYTGHSSVINLQYVYTLQKAAALFDAFNLPGKAKHYRNVSDSIKNAVYKHCYDAGRELIADQPQKITFSQHANIFAVLTDLFTKDKQTKMIGKVIADTTLAQCTYYFRFYLFEALEHAGKGELFTGLMGPWNEMLQNGLTTFAEEADPTRSDCHAWSASPLYYFISLVAGIRPASPGFSTVKIEPHLGTLKKVESSLHHRNGNIKVSLQLVTPGLNGTVELPAGLSGTFIWQGHKINLRPGVNMVKLAAHN
jgi:hypothetical protein